MADRVLVTGAGGFIGSHVVEQLVRAGLSVKAMVRYTSSGNWGWLHDLDQTLLKDVDVVPSDIRDTERLFALSADCSAIVNLAALISIPYSYHAPRSYVETNIHGTLNVLEAARRAGNARVVHLSTSEVYGTARVVPMTEDHPLSAQSPYAASKTGADQLTLSYHHAFKLPVVVVRPFNTYGPRQSMRAIVPSIITQIASGRNEVRIGNLRPTRDLTFVADTARGIVAALRADCLGRVVNLGSGFEISIGGLAELIAEIMGRKVTFTQDEERVRPEGSEVERLFASIELARTALGWQPKHVGIEGLKRGLDLTVRWFGDPANAARYDSERYHI